MAESKSQFTEKICLIGSGNWGSAIARITGGNAARLESFDNEVRMWVFEEMIEGRKLTEIINSTHENVKYLPNIKLPPNVVACPDLVEAVKDATILVFVLPHQFLHRLLPQIQGRLHPRARAISLIKGIDFDDKGLVLISDLIRNALNIDVSVLMGANVANEVALDQFCEATIGAANADTGAVLRAAFHSPPNFLVAVQPDPIGVELCGALKNIVAIGAGLVDGLGLGGNTKAAIIRIGLAEMILFSKLMFAGVQDGTFLQSCGVADLITTCYGGRNRRCAEAFVKTGQSWDVIEAELLNGQKLQGTLTAKEVHTVLSKTGHLEKFPFFVTVYRIAYEGLSPRAIVDTTYY